MNFHFHRMFSLAHKPNGKGLEPVLIQMFGSNAVCAKWTLTACLSHYSTQRLTPTLSSESTNSLASLLPPTLTPLLNQNRPRASRFTGGSAQITPDYKVQWTGTISLDARPSLHTFSAGTKQTQLTTRSTGMKLASIETIRNWTVKKKNTILRIQHVTRAKTDYIDYIECSIVWQQVGGPGTSDRLFSWHSTKWGQWFFVFLQPTLDGGSFEPNFLF